MTDISVGSNAFQVESRGWNLSPTGTRAGENPSCNLDVSAFTAATHYPNGFILNGIVLGKITATGKYAPYLAGNSDGTQTAVGILFSARKVPNLADLTVDTNSALLVHGYVDAARLPIASNATGGGYLDAAARTALKLIHFTN